MSWARAAQDGVWLVSEDEPATPTGPAHYDGELIGNLLSLIEQGERAWRELYDELGVVPCEVVYEDLVADGGWEPAIRRVLAHLALDLGDRAVSPPRAIRQANDLNTEWADRYRREAR